MKTKTRIMLPQPMKARNSQKLEEVRKDSLLKPLEGA
jgi:hypothetical protein